MAGLTLEALSKTLPECIDKTKSIQAFLSAQNKYAPEREKEGREYASRWNDSGNSDLARSLESPPDPRIEVTGGGFSSPVLKPRCSKITDRGDSHDSYLAIRDSSTKDLPAAKEAPKYIKNCDKEKQSSSMNKVSVPDKSKELKIKARTKEKVAKRKHDTSDEEREARLAQRRDRRRHKRAITHPRGSSDNTESELALDLSKEDHRVSLASTAKSKRRTNRESRKKDEKTKLPAGLALMHGFNASNVGKNRLTIEPGVSLGVFNKGRASVKTKTRKQLTVTFNEKGFLNKRRSSLTISKSAERSDKSPSICFEESSHVSSCARSSELQRRSSTCNVNQGTQLSSASKALEQVAQKSKSDYASEIWEIEKEFLHLNDIKSGEPSKTDSIIIDTRMWDWGKFSSKNSLIVANPLQESSTRKSVQKDEPASERTRMSSIAPSQSASQVPARPLTPLSPAEPQLKSKYFTLPDANDENSPRCMEQSEKGTYDNEVPVEPITFTRAESHVVNQSVPHNAATDRGLDTNSRTSSIKDIHEIESTQKSSPDINVHPSNNNFKVGKESYPEFGLIPSSLLDEMISHENQLLRNSADDNIFCLDTSSRLNFEDLMPRQRQCIDYKLDFWDSGNQTIRPVNQDPMTISGYGDMQINRGYVDAPNRVHCVDYVELDEGIENHSYTELFADRSREMPYEDFGLEDEFGDLETEILSDSAHIPYLHGDGTAQAPLTGFTDENCLYSGVSYLGMESEDSIQSPIETSFSLPVAETLEDVEMAVARDLQKRWYPVKH